MLIINNLKLQLNEDKQSLKNKIAKKLKVKPTAIKSWQIHKESLDARKKVIYIYSCLVEINQESKYLKMADVRQFSQQEYIIPQVESKTRPIVIGFGPTGIMCAYALALANLKPIVLERGKDVEARGIDVDKFWQTGILDPTSNVQFGEGGAGTFSDGKLTTRINDYRIPFILDTLIKAGANPEIKYMHHAHIGTDKLRAIVANIRQHIISLGGEVHFEEQVTDFIIQEEKLIAIKSNRATYHSDNFVLAIGHSATDTLKTLVEKNIMMQPKDFAVGVRVEHPQQLIDQNQYKEDWNHPALKASEYRLTYKPTTNHQVYSFCMCPGGYVVASSSDENTIVTNGMSYADRANKYANSAILVQVKKEDYYHGHILDGLRYQQNIEHLAWKLANNSYRVNACNIQDFMNDSKNELIFEPTYSLGYALTDLKQLFEPVIIQSLKEAFTDFQRKIPGFIEQGIMLAPETRSSSVVTILRQENFESMNCANLYPAGEGAGYAGGIMSSFLDGLRVSELIIKKSLNK